MFQKVGVWLIVGLVLFTVFKQFDKPRTQDQVTYSQFMDDAKAGKIKPARVVCQPVKSLKKGVKASKAKARKSSRLKSGAKARQRTR